MPGVERRTPLLVRVGVLGDIWLKERRDDFGVAVSEGTAVAGLVGRPEELPGLLVWPKRELLESFVGRVASDEGLLKTEGKSLDLLGEGVALAFCCSAWSRTRSLAFSISSRLSCSVWLVEADLCLTLSTSRSRELVLSWRWRLSFSAFSRDISVLLPRDLFSSPSLASISVVCFASATSRASRLLACFCCVSSLDARSAICVVCVACRTASCSSKTCNLASFSVTANSRSSRSTIPRSSSEDTLSLHPFAS